jgi:hypothetical protein
MRSRRRYIPFTGQEGSSNGGGLCAFRVRSLAAPDWGRECTAGQLAVGIPGSDMYDRSDRSDPAPSSLDDRDIDLDCEPYGKTLKVASKKGRVVTTKESSG